MYAYRASTAVSDAHSGVSMQHSLCSPRACPLSVITFEPARLNLSCPESTRPQGQLTRLEFSRVELSCFGGPAGDFPDVVRYREILQAYDITQFPKLKDSMLKAIEDSLSVDIPSLVRQFDNPYA